MLLGNTIVLDRIKKPTSKQTNIIILHILNSLTGRIYQPTHLHPLPHYCLLQILHLEINYVEFACGELYLVFLF